MFEQQFKTFFEEQKRSASGLRLEQLQKDLTGEKKLLSAVLWPVLKSFDGLIMEHEMVSISGIRIFADVFHQPLGIVFETEGYVAHAENITRDRFSFERMRKRTMATYGYKYIPFTWDELDKKADTCRRTVYELLGRYTGKKGAAYTELSVYEREVLRYALGLNRHFRLSDIIYCLQRGRKTSLLVLRSLLQKQLITPKGTGTIRYHEYVLTPKATEYLL